MKFRYISQQQQFLRALSAGIGKTAVILPAAFLTETGLGMLTVGMVFYMREVFFLSPGLVGWIAATWQSCYVLGCLTMRPAFESLRPRYSMIFSTAGMGSRSGHSAFPLCRYDLSVLRTVRVLPLLFLAAPDELAVPGD